MASRRIPGLAIALVCVAMLVAPRLARADRVDGLVGQLRSSKDYKIRLSAALNLAKVSDRRAVTAFVAALRDPDKTVRGVAAAALGKQVTASTPAATRAQAIAALKASATGDGNDFVRKQAQKAYDAIKDLGRGDGGRSAGGGGGTFISIGPMSSSVRGGDDLRKLMRRTAEKAFRTHAAAMTIGAAGDAAPRVGKRGAFFIDGTLTEVEVSGGIVSCKVNLVLATFPEKSMFGFLKGGAEVDGGSSAEQVKFAKEDCVAAVVEDLIAKKIIPTIQARTP
jgi:hypothetical protein